MSHEKYNHILQSHLQSTGDFRYIAVIYSAVMCTLQQLQWSNFGQTLHLRMTPYLYWRDMGCLSGVLQLKLAGIYRESIVYWIRMICRSSDYYCGCYLGVGVTKPIFSVSFIFLIFQNHQNTGCLWHITSIFHKCRRSWFAETPDKYECDLKYLPYVLNQSKFFTMEKWTNGTLVPHLCMVPVWKWNHCKPLGGRVLMHEIHRCSNELQGIREDACSPAVATRAPFY